MNGRCSRLLRTVGVAGVAALLSAACAVNPATRRLEFQLVSKRRELALGAAMDGEIVATTRLYADPEVADHVRAIGEPLARASERPELPWTFRVLDAPEVNAFAAPGGYVYVARDLLAYLDDDDELAAVLAHEVGHVAARHGAKQATRLAVASRAVGALRIFDPAMRHIGAVAAGSAYLSLLRHSRDQEREADLLALRYLARVGRPAAAMADVLALLVLLDDSDGTPPWLSTHPAPLKRLGRIEALGIAPRPANLSAGYAELVDGLAFGPDPRFGYLLDDRYVHPAMGIVVPLPADYPRALQGELVVAAAPGRDLLLWAGPSRLPSAEAAFEAFFSDPAIEPAKAVRVEHHGRPGLAAGFTVTTVDGELAGTAVFLDWDGSVFLFVLMGTEAALRRDGEALGHTLAALRPPTAEEADVGPIRIDVVRLERTRRLGDLTPEPGLRGLLALLNRHAVDEELPAGTLVKVVDDRALPGRRPAPFEQVSPRLR
ncbi:MAG: hypothetical protein D6705_07080 [Deltaproteobacteria bacterium]|nr:MAG: hypothetical protein D6705_07080 [Deltaproteobacteria bacterium]